MLGRALTGQLLAAGLQVRVLLRPGSDISCLAGHLIESLVGDWDDPGLLDRAVAGVELICHCAAVLSSNAPFQPYQEGDLLPAPYQQTNVDFTQALLAAARQAGARCFLFAGSASVYALDAPVPTPEDAPLRPGSLYGRSKQLAEGLVRAYCAGEMTGVIVRPALIYGPGDRYFLPPLLRVLRLPLLPLVNGGRTLIDLVHVDDVASLMWAAARQAAEPGRQGTRIYNAGPGRPVSLLDFVAAYRQVTARAPRIVNVSPAALRAFARFAGPVLRPLARPLIAGADALLTVRGIDIQSTDLWLDMSRADQELGFRPRISLPEGLAACIAPATGQ